MSNINRRLEKIEKKLCIGEKPHPVIVAGMEMASDEFAELLKEIDGTSKGVLPSEEKIREGMALCAGGVKI
jgi:hypothetical protein